VNDVKVPVDPKPAEPDRHEPAAGNFATHGVH
jgi:hypothetical protein